MQKGDTPFGEKRFRAIKLRTEQAKRPYLTHASGL
jgi:hypothetical protein